MLVNDIPGIAQLSTPEKILLAAELWDSIAADESNIPVPQSHVTELDKRLKKYAGNPGKLLWLEELQGKIESRKSCG